MSRPPPCWTVFFSETDLQQEFRNETITATINVNNNTVIAKIKRHVFLICCIVTISVVRPGVRCDADMF